jgi:hypothetical protein
MFRGEDLAAGSNVVGNVYPCDGDWPGLREILIPAGDAVAPKRFEVPPGRYVVEVVMPSGKILSEETALAEGQELTVSINDWDSPHESHAWQYFSGNLEPGSVYHGPSTIPIPRSIGSRYFDLLTADLDAPSGPTPEEERIAAPRVYWVPDSSTDGCSFERLNELAHEMREADIERIGALVAEHEPISIPEPTESDLVSLLYRFDRQGPRTTEGIGAVATGSRQFLIVTGATDAYLVTLPIPWVDVVNDEDVLVEILVNARQSPTGSPVAVTLRDRALGAGLGYLAGGALSAAKRVFQDVEGMLYEKVANPLAAAAAAYVLVGTETDREPGPWHDWLSNLRTWFGWMSDGSILWAVHTLRRAETDEQIEAVRSALVEAYGRGIPFYTLGVSWLIECLSDFPDDDECQRILKQVRQFAWRLDTRQPFVIVELTGRTS